jgi:S1-C subfamily serine protease
MNILGENHPTLTTGVVAKAEGLRDDPASFQTTVSIRPGNSGSPVFDLDGHLLGVMSARLFENGHDAAASDPNAPISLGVKAGRILRLLHGAPPIPRSASFSRQTAEEMYRRMMPATVLVAAYP